MKNTTAYKPVRLQRVHTPGDIVFNIINYTLFGIFTLLCIFPFYYLLINTISDNALVASGQIDFFPRGIHFSNYISIFQLNDLGNALVVTVARTVIGTVLSVATTLCGGFVLAKRSLPFRRGITALIMFTMFVGGGLIPTYLLVKSLHLTGSFWALILPGLTSAWNIIIARNFPMTVPASMEEAAIIDGADPFRILTRIYVPLSKPIIAVLALWSAIGHWNAWFDAMIYTPGSDQMVLSYLLRKILVETDTKVFDALKQKTAAMTPTTVKAATIVVAVVPIALLYPLFQKHFIKGINIGAVKG